MTPPNAPRRRVLWALAAAAAVALAAAVPLALLQDAAPAPERAAPEITAAPAEAPPEITAAPAPPPGPADLGPTRSLAPAAGDRAATPRDRGGSVAQSLSPYCQTPQGVCTLPSAQTIGSPCACDGIPGTIVP